MTKNTYWDLGYFLHDQNSKVVVISHCATHHHKTDVYVFMLAEQHVCDKNIFNQCCTFDQRLLDINPVHDVGYPNLFLEY